MNKNKGPISQFIEEHFQHFNSHSLKSAARCYQRHIADGNEILLTLAGAMSTAQIGLSLAKMIRQ